MVPCIEKEKGNELKEGEGRGKKGAWIDDRFIREREDKRTKKKIMKGEKERGGSTQKKTYDNGCLMAHWKKPHCLGEGYTTSPST